MFTTLIVKPIFNLLVLIYALLPGHNFGLAIIIFTLVIRLLMWPLVKKQLHHAKAMRAMQPELKRIKQAAKGDRQKESVMVMELYKERQINPFSSISVVLLQLPILLGLYSGLRRVVVKPHAIIDFSYGFMHRLPWLQQLSGNIHNFDSTLFGFVDLTKSALPPGGGIYIPALLLVFGSAIVQYYQSKQLMPTDQNARSLRQILKDAGSGKKAEQGEVNAAVGRNTRFLIPVMIFFITLGIPAALSLYWFVGGIIAYIQQSAALRQDEVELEAIADSPKNSQNIIEGEVINSKQPTHSTGSGQAVNSKQKRRAGKKRKRK